jgi:hypothetical protein
MRPKREHKQLVLVANNEDSFAARDRLVEIAAGFLRHDPKMTRSGALQRAMHDFPDLAAAASC